MKKKLQVFISSTYNDLIEERQAAVQAVLDAGHIPAGMELFKAGNNSQFETIKKWINESDVYMLILGGRYGSIEPNSKLSYTQIEYEYALSVNKPIFSVVLKDDFLKRKAIGKTKKEIFELDNIDKYKNFKTIVLSKIVRMVDDNKDIHIAVLTTLSDFLEEYDFVGWVKNVQKEQAEEKESKSIIHHKCAKCAKEEFLPSDYDLSNNDALEYVVAINKWHKINGGVPGYGSILDMCRLDFELCDDCLDAIMQEFALKDEIYGVENFIEELT